MGSVKEKPDVKSSVVGREAEPRSTRLPLAYVCLGVGLAALWLANSGRPLGEHVLRLAIVMFVAVPLVHLARPYLQRRGVPTPLARVRLSVACVIKVALLVEAAAVTLAVENLWPAATDELAAAALLLTTAVGGPLLHRQLVVPED